MILELFPLVGVPWAHYIPVSIYICIYSYTSKWLIPSVRSGLFGFLFHLSYPPADWWIYWSNILSRTKGYLCSHWQNWGAPMLNSIEFSKAFGTQSARHLMIHVYPKSCGGFWNCSNGLVSFEPIRSPFPDIYVQVGIHIYIYIYMYISIYVDVYLNLLYTPEACWI